MNEPRPTTHLRVTKPRRELKSLPATVTHIHDGNGLPQLPLFKLQNINPQQQVRHGMSDDAVPKIACPVH